MLAFLGSTWFGVSVWLPATGELGGAYSLISAPSLEDAL